MSWEHELAAYIGRNRPRELGQSYLTGKVVSPVWDAVEADWVGPLIVSILDGDAMLQEADLEQLSQTGQLHEGMTAALLPGPVTTAGAMRLQKFLILGVIGDAV